MTKEIRKMNESPRTDERPFEYAVIHRSTHYGRVVVSLWDTIEQAREEAESIRNVDGGHTYITKFEEIG